jgi:hypothetical protein
MYIYTHTHTHTHTIYTHTNIHTIYVHMCTYTNYQAPTSTHATAAAQHPSTRLQPGTTLSAARCCCDVLASLLNVLASLAQKYKYWHRDASTKVQILTQRCYIGAAAVWGAGKHRRPGRRASGGKRTPQGPRRVRERNRLFSRRGGGRRQPPQRLHARNRQSCRQHAGIHAESRRRKGSVDPPFPSSERDTSLPPPLPLPPAQPSSSQPPAERK